MNCEWKQKEEGTSFINLKEGTFFRIIGDITAIIYVKRQFGFGTGNALRLTDILLVQLHEDKSCEEVVQIASACFSDK